MVATIAPLTADKTSYYVKRYYLDGQAEGEWLDTEAARFFGLAGEGVLPTPFARLLQGFDPTSGGRLVQNAGSEKRQVGWDLQFGLHKSFSVLHALLPDIREELEGCVRDAVLATIREVLEPEFLESRRGKGGTLRERVSAPVAGFLHETNRTNEKHLHFHCIVPNLGLRPDGSTGTLVSWNLYDANHALGKAFHACFAELVSERLGIACEMDEHGLSRVRGFPEHIAEAFSTPSKRIAELAADHSAKAKEAANLEARPTKSYLPARAVDEACTRQAGELGFTPEDARLYVGREPGLASHRGEAARVQAVLDAVLSELPLEFSKADLYKKAFEAGAREAIPFAEMRAGLAELVNDGDQIRPIGRIDKREHFRQTGQNGYDQEATEVAIPPAAEVPTLGESFVQILGAIPEIDPAELREEFEEGREGAPTPSHAARLAEAVESAVEEVFAALGDGPHATAERAALAEAARGQLELDLEASPSSTSSLDTSSPALTPAAASNAREHKAEEDAGATPGGPPSRAATQGPLASVLHRARSRYVEATLDDLVRKAIKAITRREAHFTERQLGAELERQVGKARYTPLQKESAVDRALKDPSRCVELGTHKSEAQYTTPEILRVEKEGLDAARSLGRRASVRVRPERLEDVLAGFPGLTSQQRKAVESATMGADIVFIEDKSGAGLHAVQEAIRHVLSGSDAVFPKEKATKTLHTAEKVVRWLIGREHVIFVAPTNAATQELSRSAGGENVTTLFKLVNHLDRTPVDALYHHGAMIVNAALGQGTWSPSIQTLSPSTTVILDSASMADTRNFSRLLQHAEKAGARVIVCGTHRMPSVGIGGFFKELQEQARPDQVIRLTEGGGHRVRFHEAPSQMPAAELLIESWSEAGVKNPKGQLIVAASNRDVHKLNALAQERRKAAGKLGFRSMVIRHRIDGQIVKERIYEGDRVVFTGRTAKEIINGVYGTVKRIDLLTGRIKVVLDHEEKRILPWEFRRNKVIEFRYRNWRLFNRQLDGFRLGYADTIFRTQNVAVDGNSYVLFGGPGGAPSAVYARLGLAKGTTHVFSEHYQAAGLAAEDRLKEKTAAHTIQRWAGGQGLGPGGPERAGRFAHHADEKAHEMGMRY